MKRPYALAIPCFLAALATAGLSPRETYAQKKAAPKGKINTIPKDLPKPRPPTTWYYQPVPNTAEMTSVSGRGGNNSTDILLSRITAGTAWRGYDTTRAGTNQAYEVDPPKTMILTSITGAEKSDDPTRLRFGFHNLNLWDTEAERGTVTYGHWRSLRAGNLFQPHLLDWFAPGVSSYPGSWKTAQIAGAIRGVQVCMNNAETKIKGIRVFGSSLHPDGKFRPDDGLQQEYKRPNCNNNGWKTAQYCTGQHRVAVGVKVQHSQNGATGLALYCEEVRKVAIPQGFQEPPASDRFK